MHYLITNKLHIMTHKKNKLISALKYFLLFSSLLVIGCKPKRDPHVRTGGEKFQDNKEVISPLILHYPIYACANSVWVNGFIPGAEILIYADGVQVGNETSYFTSGEQVTVSINFTVGQVITAKQKFGGVLSAASNSVPVTNYKDDFPNGVPRPMISPTPLYNCGKAVGLRDIIPGAWIKVFSENPKAGGGFDPPVQIGSANDFSYAILSPALVTGARVTVQSGICTDVSPLSDPVIVQDEPSSIPSPIIDPVYEGTHIVTVWGPPSKGPLLNGATIDVFADNQPPGSERVGGQPTPGGSGQQIYVNPAAALPANFTATQGLCTKSPPSVNVPVRPCSELPVAKIKTPAPGDTQVEVTDFIPGARIRIYVGGIEIGDGGPPTVILTRPLVNGEEVIVVQQLGDCISKWIYVINVECPYGDGTTCGGDWPSFRQNRFRDAQQIQNSPLANPYDVKKLKVKWEFTAPNPRGFRASPIVYKGKVYIGNGNGYFYCLDAATGNLLWQYPAAGATPLTSQYECNPSSYGIASSAAVGRIRDELDVVIFGAPDRSIGKGLGSGRLFALNANTGAEVWKSPEIAVLDGTTTQSTSEKHEQIGYSSPLVYGSMVYIGVANHCDNPIQNGKVVAVDINSGNIIQTFNYSSTNSRGGGVWSSVAGGFNGVYITTGNTNRHNGSAEPSTNNGLSMLKLDANNGNVIWKLQPVPFSMDGDPDWASGQTLINSSCGPVALSTMKDGWTYAVNIGGSAPGPASVRWQFPETGFPFTPGDGTVHGDTRYLRPGAAWGNTFITMTGGEIVTSDVTANYNKLHAFNVCAGSANRVRWISTIPSSNGGGICYRIGSPSVTKGIVYVGTSAGHLVAIADPSVWPSQGSQCTQLNVSTGDCNSMGYQLVPIPTILLDLALPSSSCIAGEPALAGGRVFIANDAGILYMLDPK